MKLFKTCKKSESGNVLFLILIAVALFAALSYVVTQSTRSGGGSTEREQNILGGAQMTQFPTALRTALIRMVLGGVPIEEIAFNAPGNFTGTSDRYFVFHPAGGGAVYQETPADMMATNAAGVWNFNAEYHVPGLGIDTAGGNDIIAFLPGVSPGVCKQTNEELGVVATACTTGFGALSPARSAPVMNGTTGANLADNMDTSYTFPAGAGIAIDSATAGCTTIFDRQAAGCFFDATATQYVFYSVLMER